MIFETAELGPILNVPSPDFVLSDHEGHERNLESLMGPQGLLLGFIRDIWQPASIRRILYMQRHLRKFEFEGYNVALVIADKQYTLWTFYMSSPMTVCVTMLADPELQAHDRYNMIHPGLVLIDRSQMTRAKWLMPDERVWPRASDVLETITTS